MAAKSSREITVEIIAGLDVAAEFAALGVEIVGEPRASGMVSCRAIGRDDKKPSAWINTHSGFYGDSGGKDIAASTCSLFDLAVRVGKFADWKDARRFYADKAGVKLTRGPAAAKDDWHNRLIFQSWATTGNDILATRWCLLHKKGVTLEAIKAAGGQMAYYPCHWDTDKKEVVRNHNCRQVIAVPCYGEYLLDAEPVAWVCWDITGAEFNVSPKDHPKSAPPLTAKMISVGPTRGTIMGLSSIMVLLDPERRSAVKLVWKVEGPADMLTTWAAICQELRDTHLVITNGGGATSDVLPHQAKLLAGLNMAVCGDCDEAGQMGAAKWLHALNGISGESRFVPLPWPIKPSHGEDVRDYLLGAAVPPDPPVEGGRFYESLLDLYHAAAAYTPHTPPTPPGAHPARESAPAPEAPGEALGDGKPSVASTASTADSITADKIDRAIDDEIARALQIDVLGTRADGDIEVYSMFRRCTVVIKRDVAKLKYDNLLHYFSTPVRKCVLKAQQEGVPDFFPISAVREMLAHLSSLRMVGDETKLGIGCWPVEDPDFRVQSGVVLVNPAEAMFYNGAAEHVDHPRYSGMLLSFETGSRPWFNYDRLVDLLKQAENLQFRMNVTIALTDLFDKWRWRGTGDSLLAAALVYSTWVQTIWEWRPRIDVLGASNTGKSMLCRALEGIFRDCVIMTSDTTAAGLRQKIQNRAIAVVVDEVDARNKTKLARQKEILEMIRSASRGTASIRGTSGQHAVEFTLRHLVWVAGITISYDDQADRNRAVMLNLLPPLPDMAGKLVLPPASQLAELGQNALAVALWAIVEARKMAVRLKDMKVPGADSRAIESYSVPAAMLGTILGYDDAAAGRLLEDMLGTIKVEVQVESDEADLISEITQAWVRLGAFQMTVGQTIRFVIDLGNGASDREHWAEALEQRGIKISNYGYGSSNVSRPIPEGWCMKQALIINYKMVRATLLKGTRWEGQQIDQVLRNIDGWIGNRLSVGGTQGRVAMLPLTEFCERYIGEKDSTGPTEIDQDKFR